MGDKWDTFKVSKNILQENIQGIREEFNLVTPLFFLRYPCDNTKVQER